LSSVYNVENAVDMEHCLILSNLDGIVQAKVAGVAPRGVSEHQLARSALLRDLAENAEGRCVAPISAQAFQNWQSFVDLGAGLQDRDAHDHNAFDAVLLWQVRSAERRHARTQHSQLAMGLTMQ
jgi:hypothetical protein